MTTPTIAGQRHFLEKIGVLLIRLSLLALALSPLLAIVMLFALHPAYFEFEDVDKKVDFAKAYDYARLASNSYESDYKILRDHATAEREVNVFQLDGNRSRYFVVREGKRVIISLRGTSNWSEGFTDAKFRRIWDDKAKAMLHRGFSQLATEIYGKLTTDDEKVKLSKEDTIALTGHSLGGALAVVLSMYLQADGYRVDEVYTFGQPRVTDEEGKAKFETDKIIRFINDQDLVSRIPARDFKGPYYHFGRELVLLGDDQSYVHGRRILPAPEPEQQLGARGLGDDLDAHARLEYIRRCGVRMAEAKQVPYAERDKYAPRSRGVENQRFPQNDTLANDKLALFIGINDYRDPRIKDLAGCLNDVAKMKDVFVDGFGYQRFAVVTGEKATRTGIGNAFGDLISEVIAARKRGEKGTISVVVHFSGHGAQVSDQPSVEQGKDEPDDDKDETLVAYDSDYFDGSKDIRDDEMDELFTILVEKLKCQVLYIADSCHSGTNFKDNSTVRARQLKRDAVPVGPTSDLLQSVRAQLGSLATFSYEPGEVSLGLLSYAACEDHRLAFEYDDDDEEAHGRLSYVLSEILPQVDTKNDSYLEVFEKVVSRFHSRGFSYQRPQFHCSQPLRLATFLGTRAKEIPLFAEVKPQPEEDDLVAVKLGLMHGAKAGSILRLYGSVGDLRKDENLLTTAKVVSLEPLQCIAKLPIAWQWQKAYARLIHVEYADHYAISLDGSVSSEVREKLRAAAYRRTFSIDDESFQIKIYQREEDINGQKHQVLAMYASDALPENSGQPIRRVAANANVVSNILYLARVYRLLNLRYDEKSLHYQLRYSTDQRPAELAASDATDAVYKFKANERFDLALDFGQRMYVHVFYTDPSDPEKRLKQLYPPPRRADLQGVKTEDKTLLLDRLRGETKDIGKKIELKVVAADEYIDFAQLLDPPGTGLARPARGVELFDDIAGTNDGGEARFGQDPKPLKWMTGNIVVEVSE